MGKYAATLSAAGDVPTPLLPQCQRGSQHVFTSESKIEPFLAGWDMTKVNFVQLGYDQSEPKSSWDCPLVNRQSGNASFLFPYPSWTYPSRPYFDKRWDYLYDFTQLLFACPAGI